ncbi:hypothetical protein DB346_11480 [Verrucomicrobia bacterium LW23]|nr:hypothetical protein DB346_11480 [Verrucomicrobia bacterium LW23]
MKTLRVILSLPGDVGLESVAVSRIVERMTSRVAPVVELQSLVWEHDTPAFNATAPQYGAQVQPFLPAQADIVLCFLWSRMGEHPGAVTPAGVPVRPGDGRPYVTGTEYIFEEAMSALRPASPDGTVSGPHLALYIKDLAPVLPVKPRAERERAASQADYVDQVLEHWTQFPQRGEGPFFLRYRALDELLGDVEDRLWGAIIAREPAAEAIRQTPALPWRFPQEHGSPFRGLLPFEAEHEAIFFGRARAIDEAVTALKRQEAEGSAFLMLYGSAGAGKSSLLRAGLMPWVTKPGVVEGVGLWRSAIVQSGDSEGDLFEGLAAALLAPEALPELMQDENVPRRLAELLRSKPEAVGQVIAHGLGMAARSAAASTPRGQPPVSRLFLALDHLEELFGADAEIRAQRAGYITAVQALARCGNVWVVATIRTAYFVQCEELPQLMDLKAGGGQYQVPSLGADELGAIVRRPAEAAGLTFETSRQGGGALDDVLISDTLALKKPATLALLQFTLNETFKARTTDGLMQFAAYDALRGVENSLGRGAEGLLGSLRDTEQATFHDVFRQLFVRGVKPSEDLLPLWVPYAELVAHGSSRALVDAFLRAGLFVSREARAGGSLVTIAHTALVYHWPRLESFLQQQHTFENTRARLEGDTQAWLDNRRKAEWLWPPGRQLMDAEELLESERALLPRDMVRFIEASARAKRSEERGWSRRMQLMMVLLGMLMIGVAYGGVQAFKEYRRFRAATVEAKDAKLREERSTMAARRERDETSRILAQTDYLQADRWAEEGRQNWMLASLARALRVDPLHTFASTRVFYTLALRKVPLVWYRHRGALTVATFSPNGLRVLTASMDHRALVCDTASGQIISGATDHQDIIYSACFSPGGSFFLTGSADGKAQMWAVDTGEKKNPKMEHKGAVNAVTFSPDGNLIATGSEDRMLRLFNAADGMRVDQPVRHESPVKDVVWSPDGTKVATCTLAGLARIYNSKTLQQVGQTMRHERTIRMLSFSPDGTRILTAGDDGMAMLWDAATGEPVSFPFTHTGPVLRAAFSPSGKRVATVSMDKTARVWDAATGRPVIPPIRHPGPVRWVSFSPDGARIVTACEDQTGGEGEARGFARVWDLRSGGRPVSAPMRHERPVVSAVFSPDGEKILTASRDFTARLWDANTGAVTPPIMRSAMPATIGKWSPITDSNREQLILSASEDGVARLYRAPHNAPHGQPMVHGSQVRCAAFNPDGTRVATGTEDGVGRIWTTSTGQMISHSLRHKGAITAITYSPDGKFVATASKDGTAQIWDSSTGRSASGALQHGGEVKAAAISPNGSFLATAGEDKVVRLWRIPAGTPAGELKRHTRGVNSLSWSPDGLRLLSGGDDGATIMWNIANGGVAAGPLRTVGLPAAMKVMFSPDGKRFAVANSDGTAQLYEITDAVRPVGGKLEHADLIWDLDWSADSQRVATCSWDGQARVWDAQTGTPLSDPLPHEGFVWSVAFSPDGSGLLTSSTYGSRVWDLPVPGDTPAPEWFSDFVEALGGARMADTGLPIAFDQQGSFQKVRRQVMEQPAVDPFSRVAKQFFTRAQRADSLGLRGGTPGSTPTLGPIGTGTAAPMMTSGAGADAPAAAEPSPSTAPAPAVPVTQPAAQPSVMPTGSGTPVAPAGAAPGEIDATATEGQTRRTGGARGTEVAPAEGGTGSTEPSPSGAADPTLTPAPGTMAPPAPVSEPSTPPGSTEPPATDAPPGAVLPPQG